MKLLMLKGLPASGKSTYAEEVCKEQNWKRVNRDLLRAMLHFDKWSGQNEGITVEMEIALVTKLLNNGINVVVDDCNLNPKNREMWARVAKECNAKFETREFDTPWEECIERDAKREKPVGARTISGMAFQYSLGMPMEKIVICDIDGTIADTTHRLKYVVAPEGATDFVKDWKGFFAAMGDDPVREDVALRLKQLHKDGYTIAFVSGRPDTYFNQTIEWLVRNGLDFVWILFMRSANDSRPDTEVKAKIYDQYFADKKVELVIDDRPSVIRMWREKGLTVEDVGKGIEF